MTLLRLFQKAEVLQQKELVVKVLNQKVLIL